jgi:hypothetical protein
MLPLLVVGRGELDQRSVAEFSCTRERREPTVANSAATYKALKPTITRTSRNIKIEFINYLSLGRAAENVTRLILRRPQISEGQDIPNDGLKSD